MKNFKRIFGSGFKGLVLSVILLIIARMMRKMLNIPVIFTDHLLLRLSIFIILSAACVILIVRSIKALSPELRGRKLMIIGTYKYFRHPLYAAFLTFFNFGLAILLNNWIFIIWAVILHPVWHFLIRSEEKTMRDAFPGEYAEYCRKTGRFVPRFFNQAKIIYLL